MANILAEDYVWFVGRRCRRLVFSFPSASYSSRGFYRGCSSFRAVVALLVAAGLGRHAADSSLFGHERVSYRLSALGGHMWGCPSLCRMVEYPSAVPPAHQKIQEGHW